METPNSVYWPLEILREIFTYLWREDYLAARLVIRDIQLGDKKHITDLMIRKYPDEDDVLFLVRYGFIKKVGSTFIRYTNIWSQDDRLLKNHIEDVRFMVQNYGVYAAFGGSIETDELLCRPRWPEIEEQCKMDRGMLAFYVSYILRERCPELESYIWENLLVSKYMRIIHGPIPMYDNFILTGKFDHDQIEQYILGRGTRCSEVEHVMLQHCRAYVLVKYCVKCAKQRVHLFEEKIVSCMDAGVYYDEFLGGRQCPIIEKLLLKDTYNAWSYVEVYRRDGWPELEKILTSRPIYSSQFWELEYYLRSIDVRATLYERLVEDALPEADRMHETQMMHIHNKKMASPLLNPDDLVNYAINNIRGRWPLIEDYIRFFWVERKKYRAFLWKNKIEFGSYKHKKRMSYNNACAVVHAKDSRGVVRMLMIVEKDGTMNLPSGGKEAVDNNIPRKTAERELIEETSNGKNVTIDMNNLVYMCSADIKHLNGTTTCVFNYFYNQIVSPTFVKLVNRETKGMLWARVDQFKSYLDKGTLNANDEYEVVGEKFKLRGPCVNTFKKLDFVLDKDIEERFERR